MWSIFRPQSGSPGGVSTSACFDLACNLMNLVEDVAVAADEFRYLEVAHDGRVVTGYRKRPIFGSDSLGESAAVGTWRPDAGRRTAWICSGS